MICPASGGGDNGRGDNGRGGNGGAVSYNAI